MICCIATENMNYLDELTKLENKEDLTNYEIEKFENKLKNVELDAKMEIYIKNRISKLKANLVGTNYKKWDLFIHDMEHINNINEVVSFLKKIDELKDKTIDKKTLNNLEKEYSSVVLPILHDQEKVSKYYRDLCIKEINKKMKVFQNRIDRFINPEFGKRIRELREEQKMSLKDLEYVSGVTSSYIHRIENGLRKPSVEKIEKLADALHADFKELLDLLNIGFILGDNKEENEELIEVIKKNNFVINGEKLSKEKNKILEKIIESIIENDIDTVIDMMENFKK